MLSEQDMRGQFAVVSQPSPEQARLHGTTTFKVKQNGDKIITLSGTLVEIQESDGVRFRGVVHVLVQGARPLLKDPPVCEMHYLWTSPPFEGEVPRPSEEIATLTVIQWTPPPPKPKPAT